MALHHALLEQARHLASREATRPRQASLPPVALPVEPRLAAIAATFLLLQQPCHAADCDAGSTFNRVEVLGMLDRVQTAFDDWMRIKTNPKAAVFLTALLLNRQSGRS